MLHRDALRKLRSMFRRQGQTNDPASALPSALTSALSGPTLIQQEPDLAKEAKTKRYDESKASRHTRNASAWAAGGQPTE